MIATQYPARERHDLRFRKLTVLASRKTGGVFQRLTLGGPALAGFRSLGFDDHVKLFFPDDPQNFVLPVTSDEGLVWHNNERPLTRDYTPVFDAERQQLTLDIYLHDGGAASQWARRVQPGEPAFIGGPRGSLVVPTNYPWQLYVTDESGLPAVRRRLKELARTQFGGQVMVLAACHDAVEQNYLADAGQVHIEWWPRQNSVELAARLAQLLPEACHSTPWIWMAGEGRWIKQLGAPFEQANIDGRLIRLAAYWHAK